MAAIARAHSGGWWQNLLALRARAFRGKQVTIVATGKASNAPASKK
jgi:hypothetical protein